MSLSHICVLLQHRRASFAAAALNFIFLPFSLLQYAPSLSTVIDKKRCDCRENDGWRCRDSRRHGSQKISHGPPTCVIWNMHANLGNTVLIFLKDCNLPIKRDNLNTQKCSDTSLIWALCFYEQGILIGPVSMHVVHYSGKGGEEGGGHHHVRPSSMPKLEQLAVLFHRAARHDKSGTLLQRQLRRVQRLLFARLPKWCGVSPNKVA
jgi:hypothetical protein